MTRLCRIDVSRDLDAKAWWCTSDDIPGLVSEAPSFDILVERVTAVVPDLLIANGMAPDRITLDFHVEIPAYA